MTAGSDAIGLVGDAGEMDTSRRSPWDPVDLGPYLDGSFVPAQPEILHRDDGQGLFYAGDTNWVFGDSGSGKTWLGLLAAAAEIRDGRPVIWVHYEDPRVDKIVGRLLALGVRADDIADRFVAIEPRASNLVGEGIGRIIHTMRDRGIDVMILDSVGEAMNAADVNEDSDAEVGPWVIDTARQVANAGLTFIGIDHVPHGDPDRLNPSGSKRKRAAITGAAYAVQVVDPASRTHPGMSRIVAAKDRGGHHLRGATVAMMHLRPDGPDRIAIDLATPAVVTDTTPDVILAARSAIRALDGHDGEPPTTRMLVSLMRIRAGREAKLDGIRYAVEGGWIQVTDGPRNASLHALTGKAGQP